MTLHVFVAMPFGTKEKIDFNKVYEDFIKPALEKEGFDVFRADEEIKAGNIRTDMFQELLLADLVVADLSIDNPNVWYELGVRHGLRARGVIQINCQRDYMPFDVYTDRALRYHVIDGVPDMNFLDEDKKALAAMANATVSSWHSRKISPVYHHLNYLKEPDWKSLVIHGEKEFEEKQDIWERRIEVARKRQRPGDILVLADEAPIQALRLEAYYTAGNALLKLGKFLFALEQTEKALDIDPENLECRQQKGILLGRIKKPYAAKEWLEAVLEDHPNDPETLALLGRVEKDAWVNAWRQNGSSREKMEKEAVAVVHRLFRLL
ncbi:MAG: Tetratricopeptide (TPR) repeat [Candidatus Methanomarinus sp.]|nr:MAG: Tetratricopeptide (TPR) repeat [ANME-2 cluster archaeon]